MSQLSLALRDKKFVSMRLSLEVLHCCFTQVEPQRWSGEQQPQHGPGEGTCSSPLSSVQCREEDQGGRGAQ